MYSGSRDHQDGPLKFKIMPLSEKKYKIERRYLVIDNDKKAFYTNVFDIENNYIQGYVVIDFRYDLMYIGGPNWQAIDFDAL